MAKRILLNLRHGSPYKSSRTRPKQVNCCKAAIRMTGLPCLSHEVMYSSNTHACNPRYRQCILEQTGKTGNNESCMQGCAMGAHVCRVKSPVSMQTYISPDLPVKFWLSPKVLLLLLTSPEWVTRWTTTHPLLHTDYPHQDRFGQ